jgi:hypothetical protein
MAVSCFEVSQSESIELNARGLGKKGLSPSLER